MALTKEREVEFKRLTKRITQLRFLLKDPSGPVGSIKRPAYTNRLGFKKRIRELASLENQRAALLLEITTAP
jgi:hypothetical protein